MLLKTPDNDCVSICQNSGQRNGQGLGVTPDTPLLPLTAGWSLSLCDFQFLHLRDGAISPTSQNAPQYSGQGWPSAGTQGMQEAAALANCRVQSWGGRTPQKVRGRETTARCAYPGFRVWIVQEGPLRKRPSKSAGDAEGQVLRGSTYLRNLIHSGEQRFSGHRVSVPTRENVPRGTAAMAAHRCERVQRLRNGEISEHFYCVQLPQLKKIKNLLK